MGTGVRPGLSRREQEKARKKIQREADKYIKLIHSFITQEPVKLAGHSKKTLVIAGNTRDAKAMIDIVREGLDEDCNIIVWSPTQYKAVQGQLDKIIPNLKTVEVAENAQDAANLVSDKPPEDDQAKQNADWVAKHKPNNVVPMDGHKR